MAEAAVSFVLEKLANPLIQEAASLYRVRVEVDWLQRELRWMECFLKDAESKRKRRNELAKNWLSEVRDLSHRAEDIIDRFTLEINRRKTQSGFVGGLKRYAAFPSELKARHTVGAEIKDLRVNIDQIKESRERYGLLELGDSTTATATDNDFQARSRITPYFDDMVAVGFDAHKKELSDRLLDPNLARRCVVSIVGTGGLGKTTLANKVFNTNDIKERFQARASLSVSQDYRGVREICEKILKQMMSKSEAHEWLLHDDDYSLSLKLREFLTAKRYLIVLDDVWSMNVWVDLTRVALPETNNGSRVLLTTRFMNVAMSIGSIIPPYSLPFLGEDESWRLFLKKAFPNVSEGDELTRCPVKELEGIGRRLVRRCGGLPLALVVLGGVLSTKPRNTVSWMSVNENLDWGSTKDGGGDCLNILGLSYDNLPHHHLKSCFLYLGVFPEDREIEATQLIELWMAEGFIPQSKTQSMEDTAQGYLEELAQMSMIQVMDKGWLGRSASVQTFQIHDLFRDLCIREAKENGFFTVYNSKSDNIDYHNNMIKDCKSWRRLVVHGDLTGDAVEGNRCLMVEDAEGNQCLRSILVFGKIDYKTYVEQIINRLKLLRVVHFDLIINIAKFPKEIVNLTHLRYLRICTIDRSYKGHIPSSIMNLCNLQTLYVCYIVNTTFPKSIRKLHTLRHIYFGLPPVECPPDVVGHLKNLQTLWNFSACGGWIENGLEKLVNIRHLRISRLEAAQFKVFLDSLSKIERLSTLTLFDSEMDFLKLFHALSNSNHLKSLWLDGPMSQKLTDGFKFGFPPNLTTLILTNSILEQDPMPMLEELPYLEQLSLEDNAYSGKEMVCTAGGFRRLRRLNLKQFKELEEWRLEDGAMPDLISLYITACPKLSVLPEGLQHLNSLRTLTIEGMGVEFELRLQQDGGEDWYKIRHVPDVQVLSKRLL